jgi:hypothetical protein
MDEKHVMAANRSADLLGKVVQCFPHDRACDQRSIVVLLRLLASLEFLDRHVSHLNAGVRCSRGVVLLRFDDCWMPKLFEGCLAEVWIHHQPQVMSVRSILS